MQETFNLLNIYVLQNLFSSGIFSTNHVLQVFYGKRNTFYLWGKIKAGTDQPNEPNNPKEKTPGKPSGSVTQSLRKGASVTCRTKIDYWEIFLAQPACPVGQNTLSSAF